MYIETVTNRHRNNTKTKIKHTYIVNTNRHTKLEWNKQTDHTLKDTHRSTHNRTHIDNRKDERRAHDMDTQAGTNTQKRTETH